MVYRASAGGGGGSGSGTVNSGTAPQFAFYATTGTAVSGANGVNSNTVSPGIAVVGGTVTASSNLLNVAQTWNGATTVSFVGMLFSITDTSSASDSLISDYKVGGTTVLSIDKTGKVIGPSAAGGAQIAFAYSGDPTSGIYRNNTTGAQGFKQGGFSLTALDYSGTPASGWHLEADSAYLWSNSGLNAGATADTGLARKAAGVVSVTDGSATGLGFYQWGGESRVTADVSIVSSATLANITGLSAAVASGRTYTFEVVLYTTANVAGGIKAAVNATAAATFIRYEGYSMHLNTLLGQTRATSVGTAVGGTTTAIAATVFITGTITPSAAGSFTAQAAQNATVASATTILAGSYMRVFDTP